MGDAINLDGLFESAPGLYLVLSPTFEIVAVTDAYCSATMTKREAIVGRGLFEVFPDNPDDPAADGVRNLKASLERVVANLQPDTMAVQKYDIRRPDSEGGGFEVRYWSPRNFPVIRDGKLKVIIHRVEDVTEYVRLREQNSEQETQSQALRSRASQMESEILQRSRELQRSNAQLRDAQGQLLDANKKLELMVNVRTGELVSAHESLNAEIQERTKAEERFRQAQKMEAVGHLAGGVAHDFNNLLTVILSCAELMKSEPMSKTAKEDLQEISDSAQRAASLTRQLLAFSRRSVLNPVLVDLREVIENARGMLRRLLGETITLEAVSPESLSTVRVDRGLIDQVLMNLVVNARDAMPKGGKITIEVANTSLGERSEGSTLSAPAGRYVMLAVTDTGVGMSPELLSQIFLPFFTTKEVGRGTGLGLAMVHGAIKQSHGDIVVYSAVGRGTTFKLYLPVAEGIQELAPETSNVSPIVATETVMVVEDEEAVRSVIQRVLQAAGYRLLIAPNPLAALEISRSYDGPIHLVLVDVVMPELDGPAFIDRLRTERAGFEVLFMSGYTGGALVHQRVLEAHELFVGKPFTPQVLLERVRSALQRYAGSASASGAAR